MVFKAHRLLYHSTLGSRVIKITSGCHHTESPASTNPMGMHACILGGGFRVPLHRNVLWYRGGLVFEAHRHLYHSA